MRSMPLCEAGPAFRLSHVTDEVGADMRWRQPGSTRVSQHLLSPFAGVVNQIIHAAGLVEEVVESFVSAAFTAAVPQKALVCILDLRVMSVKTSNMHVHIAPRHIPKFTYIIICGGAKRAGRPLALPPWQRHATLSFDHCDSHDMP